MKSITVQCNGRSFAAIGNIALLDRRKIALFCSRKCPAGKILEAYDRFKEKQADKQTTFQRNELVAQLADELYVPYVSPDSHLNNVLKR